MSSILVALLIIGFIAGVCILLVRVEKNGRRRFQQLLLHQFSITGSAHQLSFSAQEFLHKTIIGIDGVQRKLLILSWTDLQHFTTQLVDLSAVYRCTLKRTLTAYPIHPNKRGQDAYALERLFLSFDQKESGPIDIEFYHRFNNQEWELPELESKALHWETLLLKMIAPMQRAG